MNNKERFKRDLKEVAAEIREARKQGLQPYGMSMKARYMHLALGFFRHRDYSVMEARARTTPWWNRITGIIKEYGIPEGQEGYEVQQARYEAWMTEAQEHFRKNRLQ